MQWEKGGLEGRGQVGLSVRGIRWSTGRMLGMERLEVGEERRNGRGRNPRVWGLGGEGRGSWRRVRGASPGIGSVRMRVVSGRFPHIEEEAARGSPPPHLPPPLHQHRCLLGRYKIQDWISLPKPGLDFLGLGFTSANYLAPSFFTPRLGNTNVECDI